MKQSDWRMNLLVQVLALTLFLTACGFKGDLYVPGEKEKKAKESQSMQQKP
ncbi:MAG: lipoprotein [Magnetococcus sp. YQC-5]